VEQQYVQQGYLLPTFHQAYWIGLASNSSRWPQFRWSDNSAPSLGKCAPGRWGIEALGQDGGLGDKAMLQAGVATNQALRAC
jgi:hypothetical protein